MNRPDIEGIRERCEKATPGPWDTCLGSGIHICTWVRYENPENGETTFIADCLPDNALDCAEIDHVPNMQFIAHARTDIPELLEYIVKLEQVKKAANKVIELFDKGNYLNAGFAVSSLKDTLED